MCEKTVAFESILGELIAGYIDEKKAVGYKYIKGSSLLKNFDTFIVKEHLMEKKLPKELQLKKAFEGAVQEDRETDTY